ncbi:hypothetical protein V6O07_23105 [Arthrospira platensis SPKY2]|uniref:Uncharacterized protein n=1 Tax=Limnospira indica PCC 8005 TaxID=376219 RepID=A0A9P1NZJ3_9CYAN|nr:hypothetical protein [Limnospira indica]CDM96321.1 conserved hypothetical protein [Limnospira indica PCC 8005]
MDASVDKTLLALLLALYHLKTELAPAEVLALQTNVGRLLELRPDKSTAIQSEINAILDKNPELQRLCQEAMTKLDCLDRPDCYLPNRTELETQLEIEYRYRGYFGGKPKKNTNEIQNLTVLILTSDRPHKTAKKIKNFDQYWELPQTPMF